MRGNGLPCSLRSDGRPPRSSLYPLTAAFPLGLRVPIPGPAGIMTAGGFRLRAPGRGDGRGRQPKRPALPPSSGSNAVAMWPRRFGAWPTATRRSLTPNDRGGSNLPGMSDEKADGADLERVLCAIAKDDGATPRDRVLAALTLRELAEVSAISNLQKLTRIGNLWRYRGEDGK